MHEALRGLVPLFAAPNPVQAPVELTPPIRGAVKVDGAFAVFSDFRRSRNCWLVNVAEGCWLVPLFPLVFPGVAGAGGGVGAGAGAGAMVLIGGGRRNDALGVLEVRGDGVDGLLDDEDEGVSALSVMSTSTSLVLFATRRRLRNFDCNVDLVVSQLTALETNPN